ncbi:MAG: hypothetical protein A3H94_07075 [Acidobacteria bacterium RIFCSPLOWO2_02_FULL_60_20]|nr:MAG: hypothetical protein A3H94_07075 [Acidobacteria bacterium RIFCSPLOWO2_02_FULL_60_20]
MPVAKYKGVLPIGDGIPCYVLDNGQRVVGRTSFTEMLTGIKGGGGLEKYLGVGPLKPFIDLGLALERMTPFRLPEVEGLERHVKGLPPDLLIDICQGFVCALEESNRPEPKARLTPRQAEMAIRASMFLVACAKVGLDALIDEVTGYQYERAEDALRVKLKAYLTEELRKWEKTFPDELWREFARLTNWKGSVTQRPKYWGHLVKELVYDYLDTDVAEWLKSHHPQPRDEKWHQWLTKEYGVQKLLGHIFTLIGIAKTCADMHELREKMAQLYGRVPVQLTMYLPPPKSEVGNI